LTLNDFTKKQTRAPWGEVLSKSAAP
jgi:hypothetical protein